MAICLKLVLSVIPAILMDHMEVLVDRPVPMDQQATMDRLVLMDQQATMDRLVLMDQQATMDRPDLMDRIAHEEYVTPLHHTDQLELTDQLVTMVRPDLKDLMVHDGHVALRRHTIRLDLTGQMLQAVDFQVAALPAVRHEVLMDPRVQLQLAHTDLTHQVDPTFGSFSGCVRVDGNARKQEFRKRHLVASNSG